MLIKDIISESYYDFVKDDSVEDIINHAKADIGNHGNPIYIDYVVKDNPKYDRIRLIVMAYKPKASDRLINKADEEGWYVDLRAMFIDGSDVIKHETYNAKQFQRLMDKLNAVDNIERVEEDLRAWFGKGKKGGAGGGGWDAYNSSGKRIGKCGDTKGSAKPKCLSKSAAAKLRNADKDGDGKPDGAAGIARAVKRKRVKDPDKNRQGKARNIKNEEQIMKIQDLNEVDDELDYSKKLAPVARKLFQQAYPGVKISTRMTNDDFLEIRTSDEEFRFSIAVSHQFGDNIISVGDAYSGEYRGIVSKLIKAGVDLLKKLHPEAEITLIPQHDVSDGVWQYIANKLGIGYENNSWY